MADINNSDNRGKRGKPSRMNLRVDFTPMVDMNMLLISFFMFCTTLSTPQVMDIVMPTKKDAAQDGTENTIPESKTTTLLLGADNKVYYYFGKPNYDNSNTLMVTDYSADGLRSILLDKNQEIALQIKELRRQRLKNEISEAQFKEKVSTLRKKKDGQVVVIKPTDQSSFNNLVNTLDEMQICGIGRYAVVELEEGDKFLLDNLTNNTNTAQVKITDE